MIAVTLGLAGEARPAPQRRPGRTTRPVPPARSVADTTFSHRTTEHARECSACHVFPSPNWKAARPGDAAFPDVTEFPRHASCLACHRAQFFARERPAPKICSVCHVAVTPRDTARRTFPNPAEPFRATARAREFVSAFRVAFPHTRHLEMLGGLKSEPGAALMKVRFRQQSANTVCATCHTTYPPAGPSGDGYATPTPAGLGDAFWLKSGTFKTAPADHAACFACHSVDGGLSPGPADCAKCHVPADAARGGPADFDPAAAARMRVDDPVVLSAWRRRSASATFPHEGGLHADLECSRCHDVGGAGAAGSEPRVRVQSCGGTEGCHITATSDDGGALTFEVERRRTDPTFACTKCHIGFARRPVPAAHVEAVAKAGAS